MNLFDEFRVCVCGGREYYDYDRVSEVLTKIHTRRTITELIHGGARGADSLGGIWADENNIPVVVFCADWDRYRKSAGRKRNLEMIRYSFDLLVAFPGGVGTAHMVRNSKKAGLQVVEIR